MIYSPSQTKSYLTCPQAREYNQEGWTSRIVGLRDWTAWVGQGVHAGLAAKYAHTENPFTPTGILAIGQDEFTRQYDHAVKAGRIIPGNLFYVSEAKANIERCLEYVQQHDVLPAGMTDLRPELELKDYNCILDLVGTKNGKPTFTDWKVKNKLRLDYLDQELEKYRYDWKEARHYPWALSQAVGQRVEEYHINMFILSPQFKVVSRTYKVNWPMVERWAEGCTGRDPDVWGLWQAMEGGFPSYEWDTNYTTHQSNACMGGQWPCEYLDACWQYDTDRAKMAQGGYIKVERLRAQTLADSQGKP